MSCQTSHYPSLQGSQLIKMDNYFSPPAEYTAPSSTMKLARMSEAQYHPDFSASVTQICGVFSNKVLLASSVEYVGKRL